MTRDKRVVARDLLLKADIRPSSVFGLEGEHFLLHQDNVIALVRATLQEAARAVCVWCRDGHPTNAPDAPGFCRTHTVPHSMNGHVATVFCRASEIHDLIAALDKEADRE